MKKFWQTSEFWLTIATAVGSCATAIAGVVPAAIAAPVIAVASAGYAIARGISKLGK